MGERLRRRVMGIIAIARQLMVLALVFLLGIPSLSAQQPAAPPVPESASEKLRLNYVFGPGDTIVIRVPQAEEIHEKTFRIDLDGNLSLPQVGTVKAGGLNVEQLEAELTRQLRAFYRAPVVTVTVAQYRSEPVFFIGAFKSPGIYPLQGRRTLVEMLAVAGGLQPNASRRIKVTRKLPQGRIPLSGATDDRERDISVVEINIGRLMETANPEEDIELKPNDVLRASAEEMVYVSGAVGKTGGFPLADRDSISVMQLLALTGGLAPDADPQKAKILRPVLDTARRAEIPLNVKTIIDGRANDFPLLPNDVLVVPRKSSGWSAVSKVAWIAIPSVISALIVSAIYRR